MSRMPSQFLLLVLFCILFSGCKSRSQSSLLSFGEGVVVLESAWERHAKKLKIDGQQKVGGEKLVYALPCPLVYQYQTSSHGTFVTSGTGRKPGPLDIHFRSEARLSRETKDSTKAILTPKWVRMKDAKSGVFELQKGRPFRQAIRLKRVGGRWEQVGDENTMWMMKSFSGFSTFFPDISKEGLNPSLFVKKERAELMKELGGLVSIRDLTLSLKKKRHKRLRINGEGATLLAFHYQSSMTIPQGDLVTKTRVSKDTLFVLMDKGYLLYSAMLQRKEGISSQRGRTFGGKKQREHGHMRLIRACGGPVLPALP